MTLGSFNLSLCFLPSMAAGHREDKQFNLNSYGLRRLAPTFASSADLPLHERLPFGNWKVGCFSSTEREAAKKFKPPRLYADISSKEESERIVKEVVWRLVDAAQSSCSGGLKGATWADLAPAFRQVTAARRMHGVSQPLASAEAASKDLLLNGDARARKESSSSSSSSFSSSLLQCRLVRVSGRVTG